MLKVTGLLLFILSFISSGAQTGSVRVEVSGILAEKGGEISAGIFDQAKKFPKITKSMITRVIKVTGSTMEVINEDIEPGYYAIAIFQDIDQNKDLNSNFIGFPREPLGFSNNPKVKFGPPGFEDAMIKVESNKTIELSIKLIDY